jgi:hypothetical protein
MERTVDNVKSVIERGYLLILPEELLFQLLVLRLCSFSTFYGSICLCAKGGQFLKEGVSRKERRKRGPYLFDLLHVLREEVGERGKAIGGMRHVRGERSLDGLRPVKSSFA